MDKPQVILVRLVVAGGNTAALLGHRPETFGQMPVLVEPFVILQRCLAAFEWRNDRLRSQCSNVSTNAVAVVPLVGDDGLGAMVAQQRTSMSGVRFLACSQLQDHGNATCIDRYVQLAAEATSRAPQCLFRLPAGLVFLAPAACTWARTIVVSRINWSKSGSPPNACETRAQTPDFDQRLKRRNTLFQDPYRSGRSRQGAPVLAIHKTASTNSRFLARRPRIGNKPLINAHCSSVIAWRCNMTGPPWLTSRPAIYQNRPAYVHTT